MTRALPIVAAALFVCGLGASATPQTAAPSCGNSFAGFDTRLKAQLLTVLPVAAQLPVGFELTAEGPAVATTNALFIVGKAGVTEVPLDRALAGLAIDDQGRLALQFADGVSLVTASGFAPVSAWSKAVTGRVLGSGAPSYVEAVTSGNDVRIGVRALSTAKVLPVASLSGVLRTAVWDPTGLTAVVGQTLMRWRGGSTRLEQMVSDPGLEAATGVCSFGTDRVIVNIGSGTLLFGSGTMTVLAATGTLCRTSGDIVYLFDSRTRRVWKLSNTTGIGDPVMDLEHATRLLRLAVTQDMPYAGTREFSEAVRLIGCKRANTIALELRK